MTLAVERSGKVADCVYNYRTEAEAVELLRLVGYAEAHHAKLAPIMAWARQALYPRDIWWLMWRGFSGVDGIAEVRRLRGGHASVLRLRGGLHS